MKELFVTLCAVFIVLCISFGMAPSVHASLYATYELTSDHMTDGAGDPPFGIVELWEKDDDVQVVVTLNDDGSQFVRTGAGSEYNFLFNGTDVLGSDVGNLSGYHTVEVGTGTVAADGLSIAQDIKADGTGYWQFGVYFSGQDTGGSNGSTDPLGFTVHDATIAELTTGNGSYIFAADILSGQTGNTGMVDVSSPVPIPGAIWLLGSGLIGIAGIRRMFNK